ncbi:MAG: hypothetical protein ACJ71U_18545 [Terriglobales bacterium]
MFRRNGEQCKAPAEKGKAICHAHAAQQATAFRRDLERRIVLAEAVAEMRRQGRPECELADLFTDFKGIQVTLAMVSRALINGRIDCKTAGRMLVHLQTMSKLLWMLHGKRTSTTEARRHGEKQGLPQICADERGSNKIGDLPEQEQALLTTKITRSTSVLPTSQAATPSMIGRIIYGEGPRVAFEEKLRAIPEKPRGLQNGKWEQTRAA